MEGTTYSQLHVLNLFFIRDARFGVVNRDVDAKCISIYVIRSKDNHATIMHLEL
mgnify:FL=1